MVSDESEADFLRRLSVADAKVLLERTRKEKENKTKEMQKMISVRYRDLIESADKIVNMHSAALRLEGSLKEMPDTWKHMDLTLAEALTITDPSCSNKVNRNISSLESQPSELVEKFTNEEKAVFLAEVPEMMWQSLDKGETLQSLMLYQVAIKLYCNMTDRKVAEKFPFLQAQWACIQSFKPRLLSCADSYLTCRGLESHFYANNLCALVVLNDSPITAGKLFEIYLNSRHKWMMLPHKSDDDKRAHHKSSTKEIRALIVILKSIIMTITQAEEIFGSENEKGILQTMSQLSDIFKNDLAQFCLSGELLNALNAWFQWNRRQILDLALPIISSINSISLLSKIRSRLYTISMNSAGYENVSFLSRVHGIEDFSKDQQASVGAASIFSVLFAKAFRKQTRDLVQNCFAKALDAIKLQIRASLDATAASFSQSECRLRNMEFFDYFDHIHKKAADLDGSDLQVVLKEEFFRTLFKLVFFFEQEYSHVETQDINAAIGAKYLPSVYLSIANILAGIVAGFQSQIKQLFPGSADNVLVPDKDPSLSIVGNIFDKYSRNGFVEKAQFDAFFEDTLGDRKGLVCFIDEELNQVDAVGFYSLYLFTEIRLSALYPQSFVNVLYGLSKKYCQTWASILVKQKIQPLREFLLTEQYNLTNEKWIDTHESWTEQVIASEVVDDDSGDILSDTDVSIGDEKIWLPWCETPAVSSCLFSCCYCVDDANRMIQNSLGASKEQIKMMHRNIHEVFVEQVTIVSVSVYDNAVSLLVDARATQSNSVLNFGECCIQQFLFDMYFVRATLGSSDFIRFGWGDELSEKDCSCGLVKLKGLFERMREFIDPVDWEIYGPQLIQNVVLQFRKSRLLFSSLSESNDINKINGKEVAVEAQTTKPLARIAEPVARFSLLPVPSNRRGLEHTMSRSSHNNLAEKRNREANSSLFHERIAADNGSQSSSITLQNLLSSSASANLFSATTSGTNLFSSAAKGIVFFICNDK
ncbi:Low density lipoprotein B-like protein [Plasmopara halstedii]|uniref:Conserved oligomeric Golgi complex subunit 1 n=1 Tax=Plasmopara halstedii TaxID=4781 RepID=A0A0P1AFX8_PLAHL|nr:Low density lipoprotein B-like protein [Plasmopara halstedii]CEG40038.1 Low density lipoprotein B-like protein [Plasmopara halstedii]|eukprot:XP_024576407.1 Low density lipoprotein B-like protein [Plasmopara halstedii]